MRSAHEILIDELIEQKRDLSERIKKHVKNELRLKAELEKAQRFILSHTPIAHRDYGCKICCIKLKTDFVCQFHLARAAIAKAESKD